MRDCRVLAGVLSTAVPAIGAALTFVPSPQSTGGGVRVTA